MGVNEIKAAVLETIGSIRIEDRPEPQYQEGDMILKTEVCGLCRTDMKAYTIGQRDLRLPRVLGHEITATVVEACSQTGFRPGDRVQVSPGVPCGNCHFCRQGLDHLCDRVEIMGFHRDGGFQEYLHIPAAAAQRGILNHIPAGLSFEEACMSEPLACAINMQDALHVGHGDAVLIWGGGPLGILNARLARSRGAEEIFIVENHPDRIMRLQDLENRCHLLADLEGLRKVLTVITDRGKADVVIPCCPDPDAFRSSLQVCSKRGRIGFFSGMSQQPGFTNDEWNLLHYLELTVIGAYGCSIRNNRFAMQLMERGDVVVKDLISRRIGLDELQEGLDLIAAGKEMKIAMDMKKGR